MASRSSNTNILIKRSLANNTPGAILAGELAYSYASNTLFIGTPGSDSYLEIGAWSNLSSLSAGTYGGDTQIPTFKVDEHGKITHAANVAISTTLNVNGDSGHDSINLRTDSLTLAGGDGITTTASGTTVTFNVNDTVVRANTAGLNQTIDGVVNISGDLHVSGNISYTDVTTLVAQNSLIFLANNNVLSDVVDIGFVGQANNGTGIIYTGLFRHAGDGGDKQYYLFDNYTVNPDNTYVIDPYTDGFKLSTLNANIAADLVTTGLVLAAEGLPNGTNGYSFQNDGGYDTGMFSPSDGELFLYTNAQEVLQANNDTGITLFKPVTFAAGGAKLHDTSNHSLLFGTGVQDTGSSQRVSIGFQPDTQTGQSWDAIAIGSRAGTTNQRDNAIAIGNRAGYTGQSESSVAIGGGDGGDGGAGQIDQGYSAVAIGNRAGYDTQGQNSVAVGHSAGQITQEQRSVAIGYEAGYNTQGQRSVAIGAFAAYNQQQEYGVAIGYNAGNGDGSPQGRNAIAIGAYAGVDHQHEYSIALNASGNQLNPDEAGLYIDPIRNDGNGGSVTTYNTTTKEVVYTNVSINNEGITLANGTNITDTAGSANVYIKFLQPTATAGNITFYNPVTGELTYGNMGELRPDQITNNGYTWAVDGTTGALFSDAGTYIADSSNSVVIGQNMDLTNSNVNRVAIGNSAGQNGQNYGSVAIGEQAGNIGQSYLSVALGLHSGYEYQNHSSVAVGHGAAYNYQGSNAVAVGNLAGKNSQGSSTVAVGDRAGYGNIDPQGYGGIAIGAGAAYQYQNNYGVAIGYQAAYEGQGNGGIAIGDRAAYNGSSADSIAIGTDAGYNSSSGNGWAPIAIGRYAGKEYSGSQSVAIGSYAGNSGLGYHAVAIGHYAASSGSGQQAVAIGDYAGQGNIGERAVAIGVSAGYNAANYSVALGYGAGWDDGSPLGQYQVAIGAYAAAGNGHDNSIVLNATGNYFDAGESGLFIKPVRYTETQDADNDGIMFYNQSTGEVRYSYVLDGGSF